jgi:glycosyltransferase involved in cell wall biosynthesis
LIHDLMGRAAAQSGVLGGGRVASVVAQAEMYAAKRANRIGIIADAFRPYFESAGIARERIDRLRTWSLGDLAQQGADRGSFGLKDEDFVCLHAGSMGYKQDLNNLLDAARRADDSVLFVLAGDGSERSHLLQRCADEGLRRVVFLDSQPWGKYERMLESADVLLINQRETVREMSLPSKLTSYFAAARPIVAAVPPRSETASEVTASRAGVIVPPGDPRALLDAIMELRRDPGRRDALGRNGREFALRNLTPDAVLPTYEGFVTRILHTP